MSIPVQSSARNYLEYLNRHVHEAVAAWKTYADASSAAYAAAYERQGRILRAVKERIEADRKRDDAMLSFFFSMLTVAAAGPIGGCLAGKLTFAEEAAAKEFTKWAKDTAGKVAKAGTTKAVKYLWPETLAHDPFEPAEISPVRYMATMLKRIDERDRNLTHVINERMDDVTLTPDGARNLAEEILNSSFIKETPPDISDSRLQEAAGLALWIGWAFARDREYWQKYSNNLNEEVFEFRPVLDELGTLGVPSSQIRLTGTSYRPFGLPSPEAMRRMLANENNGLNMDGFIKWACSPLAIELLFSKLPKNEDTHARKQMMILRMNLRRGFGM